MTASVHKWDKSVEIPVIDALTGTAASSYIARNGKYEDVKRVLWNAPIHWVYPELLESNDVIMVDWNGLYNDMTKQLDIEHAEAKKAGRRLPAYADTFDARLRKALEAGVDWNGKHYSIIGWGSAAKNRQTICGTDDFFVKSGHVVVVEDLQRIQRAFFSNGLYGGGVVKMRVLVAGDDTVHGGHPIHDGCNIMFRDVFEQLRNDRAEIALGDGAQSYQVWQRFDPTPAFWKDYDKAVEIQNAEIDEVPMRYASIWGDIGEYKLSLIEADESMIHHPYIAAKLLANTGEILFNMSTVVPIPVRTKVVLPSVGKQFVFSEAVDGAWMVDRYPITNDRSTFMFVVDTSIKAWKKELERLLTMQAAQTTWTCKTMSTKQVDQIVPRFTDKYDAVLNAENVKIVVGEDAKEWRRKNVGHIIEIEVFVSVTQFYESGSIALVDMAVWAENTVGDADGDLGMFSHIDAYPEIQRQLRERVVPRGIVHVVKSRTYDFKRRTDFLLNSFNAFIGFASNVMSMTYCLPPSDRWQIASWLHQEIPGIFDFSTNKGKAMDKKALVEAMDWVISRDVKSAEDEMKTLNVDVRKTIDHLGRVQTVISTHTSGAPAWPGWRRSSRAFRHELPKLRSELPKNYIEAALKPKSELRRYEEWRMHIPDIVNDGCTPTDSAIIYQMYLRRKPFIEEQFNKLMSGGNLSVVDAMKPGLLSDYEGWAPPVDDVQLTIARDLVNKYYVMAQATVFEDNHQSEMLTTNAEAMCNAMVEESFGGDRRLASFALWRAAHHSRSKMGGAAAVFRGMPAEAMYIVKNKPGLHSGTSVRCRVTGVEYSFSKLDKVIGPFIGRIVSMPYKDSTRLVLVTEEKLKNHTGQTWGADVVGLIARHDFNMDGYSSPVVGKYLVNMYVVKDKDGKPTRVYDATLATL